MREFENYLAAANDLHDIQSGQPADPAIRDLRISPRSIRKASFFVDCYQEELSIGYEAMSQKRFDPQNPYAANFKAVDYLRWRKMNYNK